MSSYTQLGAHYFILEGNIGAGKSTFLRILQDYLPVQVLFEPLQDWQNVDGENLLDRFYQDTQRWAYTFQSYAFLTRIRAQQAQVQTTGIGHKGQARILERSVYSDYYCFAKNCFEQGLMSSLEWRLYQDWFSWLTDQHVLVPQGFIYLRTDPEVCYKRLLRRNRFEEHTITREYLDCIHRKHEDWLVHKKDVPAHLVHLPVIILECNEDFEANKNVQQEHIRLVANFLETQVAVSTHEHFMSDTSK